VADDHSNVVLSSPQLDVQDILREVDEVARECSAYIFPFRRIRCRTKTRAERKHIAEVRLQLFERSHGQCELGLAPECWGSVSWFTMHSAHIVSKARGGPFTLSNLKASCPECHGWEHGGGKVCPKK
jgi:5-methylcytosine-specific restriction endonuclease McrA